MDMPLAITLTGGTVSGAALIIAFIQWSLKRNVEHEDKAKDSTAEKLEHHAAELASLKTSDMELRGELKALNTAVSQLTGAMGELKLTIERNREGQADFYRGELGKAEQRLEQRIQLIENTIRQEITRAVTPETAMRVKELESEMADMKSRLTVLETRRKR